MARTTRLSEGLVTSFSLAQGRYRPSSLCEERGFKLTAREIGKQLVTTADSQTILVTITSLDVLK
jgi:hypothetical protein